MRAVLLAAGVGKRLKPLTDTIPKSLISIGERTVLERMLDSLIRFGIKDICIVVGHLKEKIIRTIGTSRGSAEIGYIINPQYEKGSILSVWAARDYFNTDILLMDSDVIFEDAILERLIRSKNENCFLLDKNFNDTGEEMKLAALSKKVVQIARRITEKHDEIGEGVGFFKLSGNYHKEFLRAFSETISKNDDSDYENALDEFVRGVPAGFEDITGIKWTEIDFPEDIEKAKTLNL